MAEVLIDYLVHATKDRVWQAFTEPEVLRLWYAAPGWTIEADSAEIHLRAGGAYRVTMRKEADPTVSTTVTARFIEVTPESRLVSHETVFGASGLAPAEMTLAIELTDDGDGTVVSVRQGPFPYGVDALARAGWLASLTRLDVLLARADAAG
jgi:uncharacterized protein YndB with AHSA1/START domain